jgi:acyl carrier protein phosphodiesterase
MDTLQYCAGNLDRKRSFDVKTRQTHGNAYICSTMNHLAHCFLSFDDEDVLLGNFIGDYVKGNDWQQFPIPVQRGILLHRRIDAYTDAHAWSGRSVTRVRPFAGRYSPPMIDIVYDHLLSLHWTRYSQEPFDEFAGKTYTRLARRAAEMHPPLQERLPRMLGGRFLHGYGSREGMAFVMEKFGQRLPATVDSLGLLDYFFDNLPDFEADFAVFFPELFAESQAFLQKL